MSVLLLDTNVWCYLGQETKPNTLAGVLAAAGHRAAVGPNMLTEVLDTADVARRTSIIDMMCSYHWLKLRSTMDLQAEELTGEVRRLRANWLRSRPKTDRLHSMREYWTKVYWREAKCEPEAVIARRKASKLDEEAKVAIAHVQAANKTV